MGAAGLLRAPATSGDRFSEVPFLPPLDRHARIHLLRVARGALEAILLGKTPEGSATPAPNGWAPRSGGAFVSLHDGDGDLRGCLGRLSSQAPLEETVARLAAAAATEDRRFPPVRPSEVNGLVIEISVLSPLRRARPPEVEVGRHGLLLRASGASGVLLPQVAVANGWDREEFLRQTAWKAGLPRDAWRRPEAEIFLFTADVFSEI